MNLDKEVFEINLSDIIPNRFQPREIFNDEQLKELADSIREHGVIQPIIVRKVGDKYEIIAGERRYRASRLAGKQTIPALVRDIDDREAAKIALLENLQRSNLTPIEEAKTYQTILKIDNITQEELAKSLGKTQGAIANKIRLLSLSEDVQTALLNSQISERHARSLLSLPSNEQSKMLQRIINEKLTVRQLDEEIMKITGKAPEAIEEDRIIQQAPTQAQTNEINAVPIINQTSEINPVIESQKVENQVPIASPIEEISNVALPTEEPQISSSIIVEKEIEEQKPQIDPELGRPLNIFDRLRVQTEENKINNSISSDNQAPIVNSLLEEKSNEIYDLRFAINNFRQAIQNTEKFGFKVKSSEYDSPNKYQFVIEIDKN